MSARRLCHDELTMSCLTMSSNKGADNQDKYKDCRDWGKGRSWECRCNQGGPPSRGTSEPNSEDGDLAIWPKMARPAKVWVMTSRLKEP